MSEFYFDVSAWEKDVEGRKRAEKEAEESGIGGKRKRPSKKDLVSSEFFFFFVTSAAVHLSMRSSTKMALGCQSAIFFVFRSNNTWTSIPRTFVHRELTAYLRFYRNGSKNRRSRRRSPRRHVRRLTDMAVLSIVSEASVLR